MRYRYLDDFRRGISVFAIFSYGIAVLGTPQCPPHTIWGLFRERTTLVRISLEDCFGFHVTILLVYKLKAK